MGEIWLCVYIEVKDSDESVVEEDFWKRRDNWEKVVLNMREYKIRR